MNHAMSTGLTEALEYEASVQDIAGRSLDFNEGVAAFVEKREPNYRGE
jgi:2-(1,2-epoxy-1,2-dihydrophenyl)acetyl-CoA isomerase